MCERHIPGVNKLFTPDVLTTHKICSGRSSFFNRHQTSIIPSQKYDIVNLLKAPLSRCERQIKGVNKLFTVDACRPLTKHALELCSPPSASKELYILMNLLSLHGIYIGSDWDPTTESGTCNVDMCARVSVRLRER